MATETKHVTVSGKQVKMVTYQENEVHPELIVSYLTRGSVKARVALVADQTKPVDEKVRRILVKNVFREQ